MIELTGSSSTTVDIPYTEVYGHGIEDMLHRIPSTAKINAALGWEPERSLEDILRDVIAFERGRVANACLVLSRPGPRVDRIRTLGPHEDTLASARGQPAFPARPFGPSERWPGEQRRILPRRRRRGSFVRHSRSGFRRRPRS